MHAYLSESFALTINFFVTFFITLVGMFCLFYSRDREIYDRLSGSILAGNKSFLGGLLLTYKLERSAHLMRERDWKFDYVKEP